MAVFIGGVAPINQHLISVSIVGDIDKSYADIEKLVRKELETWFGKATEEWRHLHTRTVQYALPDQTKVVDEPNLGSVQLRPGLFITGDHLLNGSINAAMKAGRITAECVIQELIS